MNNQININTFIFAVLLLLAVAVTACGRRHHIKKGTGLLIGESEDDIRDNVFNYDEQGGGEEDEVRLKHRLGDHVNSGMCTEESLTLCNVIEC